MEPLNETLKCPACQDLFTDPVKLPCRHDFCLTCIQTVCEEGPLFCPECQILLPPNLTLEIDANLQNRVKEFIIKSSTEAKSSTIFCDHCIETPSEAIRTCLTCDASLCQAHALLHQQRSALREHTVVNVTQDLLSLKCKEHRDELKLFCLEDRVPSMLETTVKQLLQIRCEAENAIKDLEFMYTQTMMSSADFRERISDKYNRIRVVLDGDERLMMQIIDAEEEYMSEWLESQRGIVEAHIKEIDNLRVSSKLLLQETHDFSFIQQITAQNMCDPPKLAPIQKIDRELCEPDKMRTVEKLVDDLSVALSQYFPRMWSYLSCPALDLKTAHPKLEISQDGRQVCWGVQPSGDASTTRPYDSQYSVFSQKSFTSGQHYWEVIVQEKPYWLIGVTSGPITGDFDVKHSGLGVNKTSWCIYHGEGLYMACHDTQEKQLNVGKKVRKLGILANLPKGELSFYNADTMTLLHSFCVECKEPLFPMLNPCIDVNGLNRQPLTMFWIKDPWDWSGNTDGGDEKLSSLS
ncbi:E3 ubiquitin-protein ligase Midline-1-like [Corythoichthys intestinalis]|uniref:E3 ubiquitin-protein ligase Midline-1-like n=1 Tax=Corythoichthys intestinalis TaxID=161448 RepID=UPI0025A5B0AC|nr:E3 ubiquitin-protein ligase Midline-1-like [Corythoichthys intestinalis]